VLRSRLLLLLTLATGIFASSSANAVLTTTVCGPLINNVVRTENTPSVINAVAFVNLPGAVAGFNVPAGQTRCIKVLFTGETVCRGPAAIGDFCLIRARQWRGDSPARRRLSGVSERRYDRERPRL
jgi:hypothetical protein